MVAGTIATIGSWVGANAAAISTVATVAKTVSDIKGQEASIKAQKEQKDMLEKQNKQQADAISSANAQALNKRKELINRQRKQILGSGDSQFNLNPTGATGISSGTYGNPASGGSLTGGVLG